MSSTAGFSVIYPFPLDCNNSKILIILQSYSFGRLNMVFDVLNRWRLQAIEICFSINSLRTATFPVMHKSKSENNFLPFPKQVETICIQYVPVTLYRRSHRKSKNYHNVLACQCTYNELYTYILQILKYITLIFFIKKLSKNI